MMNFKGDEVVARFKAEWRQQCLNLTPVGAWAEKKEERCPSDTYPAERAATLMC